jgi:hypothetical protein
MRGKGESGIETMFRNDGRIEERLRVFGYEVRRVLPKTWQGDLLDLDNFEVPVTRKCKPRLADGWTLTKRGGAYVFATPDPTARFMLGTDKDRAWCMRWIGEQWPEALVTTKTVLSHDTKAASLAYVRANFPDLNLIPPRARNPHDGLADAVCIAVWGSRQIKETA